MLWPGPSVSADTTLGGYQAVAEASVVHIEVYEPTIPIPASPQGDFSIGYTRSNVDTGPTTRALASYLWPGVVIGDGFDQLTKHPGSSYPVQVNSRFPATTTSPATNTIQITQGNGMTTATDGFNTTANVTGLGIAGDGVNLLGGIGQGLSQLGGKAQAKPSPTLPLPVSDSLAALVSASNLTSDSTVTVADKTVTSIAHAAVSDLALLGGIIQIKGVDVVSKVVSDGTNATTSGDAQVASISVAGTPIAISAKGNSLSLPSLSQTVSTLLGQLGVALSVVTDTENTSGAQGTMVAQSLQISIDTAPLKQVLDNVLNPLIARLPANVRQNLSPVLGLAPKIVLTIGNTNSTATASPAFNDNFGGGGFGGSTTGTGTTAGVSGGAISAGTSLPPGTTGSVTAPNPATQGAPMEPVSSRTLPALGEVPRMLIFGSIVLAALLGWLITTAAGFLFAGAGTCDFGLTTGLPDLRKG
jgi:hypothetical protein